eukprot:12773013-Alexandrium_andersonii.AAC.1
MPPPGSAKVQAQRARPPLAAPGSMACPGRANGLPTNTAQQRSSREENHGGQTLTMANGAEKKGTLKARPNLREYDETALGPP